MEHLPSDQDDALTPPIPPAALQPRKSAAQLYLERHARPTDVVAAAEGAAPARSPRVIEHVGASVLPKAVAVPVAASTPSIATPETGTSASTSFTERLSATPLKGEAVEMPPRGKHVSHAGGGERFRLPLEATHDGSPLDVLFTVSVGGAKDEAGRRKMVGPSSRSGTQLAITAAARNFAVVRNPADTSGATYLLEVSQAELATGRCDYTSTPPPQGQEPRTFAAIPGTAEAAPLSLSIPVTPDQWDAPVTVEFQMGNRPNELMTNTHGQPDSYMMIAHQL